MVAIQQRTRMVARVFMSHNPVKHVSLPGRGMSRIPVKHASVPGKRMSRFPVRPCLKSRYKPVSVPGDILFHIPVL
jgi:hypothetical protein